VYECYDQKGESESDCLSFETHEWGAHGVCSGAADAEDFFTQVCGLADPPLAIMNATRYGDGATDLNAMADALTAAGYEIFAIDTSNSQLELSACAGPDTRWKFAAMADFPTVCGGWSDDLLKSDDDTAECLSGSHGPSCSTDAQCLNVTSCVRCASSGYCTDVPLVF
jgi:hypothetical protein